MALDVTEKNLRLEVEAAIKLRKGVTDASMDRIRRTAGPDYRADWERASDEHENHGFEFCTNFVPSLVFTNPGVDCESDVMEADDEQIVALQEGLNRWCHKVRLSRVLTRIAWDVCHDFGVAMVTLEALPGYGDDPDAEVVPLYPVVHRISPRRFFADSQGTKSDLSDCRLMGHVWVRDKDDLLNAKNPDGSPAFDEDAVNAVPLDEGMDELRKEQGDHAWDKNAPRKQIMGYEVYVPETGMIYTMAHTTPTGSENLPNKGFLRAPRPYIGPRRGPYVLFGLYLACDQLYPVAPLAVTESLVRELNAHSGQVADDAASAKRLILIDGNQKQLAEGVRTLANGNILIAPGFNGAFAQVEFGGAQPANIEHIGRLRERLDRRSGLSQTMRGNITGATATEVNEATQSSDIRTRFASSEFSDCVVDLLEIVAEHMHTNDQVRFPIAVTDPITGKKTPKVFIGGPQPGQPYTPFEMMRLRIRPYSMEIVDQNVLQKRMQTASALTIQLAQALPMNPQIKGRNLVDDLFESLNIKGGGDRYIDFGIISAMQGAPAGAQPGGAPPGPPMPDGSPTPDIGVGNEAAGGPPTGAAPGIAEHAAALAKAAAA